MKKANLKKNAIARDAMSWTDEGKRPKEYSAKFLREFQERIEQKKAEKKELEELVEENDYVEQVKCPSECCEQCPERKRLLAERYKELDDDFDDELKKNKFCSIAWCPIFLETIMLIAIALLLIFLFTK